MKLKSLGRTAQFAWSPVESEQLYLVLGTAAVKLDETFSTSSVIELCEVDYKNLDGNLNVIGSVKAEKRFYKVIWGEFGLGGDKLPIGTVVTGCESGIVSIYNPANISKDQNSLIHQSKGHSGPVRALDLNRMKTELLASGSSNSEIFIWDLNKPSVMMSPGPKSHSSENITSVAWNAGVAHILGSVSSSKALMWDLRKGDGPIVTVGDFAGGKACWREISWHPTLTTSFCLASDLDQMPIIQHWDLRYATAPLLQMSGHQRGVIDIDWCAADPNLLISCSNDGKIYIWNPNTGTYLAEIPSGSLQGAFQVSWCRKNPFLIGLGTYEKLLIETIIGNGGILETTSTPSLADSFPGMDFSQRRDNEMTVVAPTLLPVPPSWMMCPHGARFSFGGTLVTFNNMAADSNDPSSPAVNFVNVQRMTTDPEFCERALQLLEAVKENQLAEYCQIKLRESEIEIEKQLWEFMMVNAGKGNWQQFATILGYNPEEVEKKVDFCADNLEAQQGSSSSESDTGEETESDLDSLSKQAKQLNLQGPQPDLVSRPLFDFPADESFDGVLSQAVLCGKLESAVHLCLAQHQWSYALILSSMADENLFPYCVRKYLEQKGNAVSKVIDAVYCQKWTNLIDSTNLNSWVETLCCLLANIDNINQRRTYIDMLAKRLETDNSTEFQKFATICHVVSGNLEAFTNAVQKLYDEPDERSSRLQKTVEFALTLAFSLQQLNRNFKVELPSDTQFSAFVGQFLFKLLEQGLIDVAYEFLNFFSSISDQSLFILQDRILGGLGDKSRRQAPFPTVNVLPAQTKMKLPPSLTKPAAATYRTPVPPSPSNFRYSTTTTVNPPPPPTVGGSKPLVQAQQNVVGQLAPVTQHQHVSGSIAGTSPRERYPSSKGYDPTNRSYSAMPSSFNPIPPVSNAQYRQQPLVSQSTYSTTQPAYASAQPTYPSVQQINSSNQSTYSTMHPTHNPPIQQQQPVVPPPQISHVHYSNEDMANGVQPRGVAAPTLIGRRAHIGSQHRPWNDPPPISPKQHNFPVPTFHPDSNGQSQVDSVSNGISQASEAMAPAGVESIPEPHRVIKTVYDRLIQLCYQRADNAHVKKKLEDVGMKLESELYPMLRSQKLANASLLGLHHIVNNIQAGNYTAALESHRQMVQSEDFPQLASFMPSLKVLLHTASQLNVLYGH